MKPESAKQIIEAYLDVFEELSLRTFKQGLAFVVDSFEQKLKLLRQVRTREGLEAALLKEPEPEPDALESQIESIRLLPYTLRKVMPEAMRDFSNALPHDPGGRPALLTEKDCKYVCEEIGKLYGQGVPIVVAQDRLARRMSQKKGKDVGIRTIQRAWQQRREWSPSPDLE